MLNQKNIRRLFTQFQKLSYRQIAHKSIQTKRPPPSNNRIPNDQLSTFKTQYLENRQKLGNVEWQQARNVLIAENKHINAGNVDAIIVGLCRADLPVAKDYVRFLQEQKIEPNLATWGRLLRVYNAAYHSSGELSMEQQKEVLKICEILQSRHSVLDSSSCEHVIQGLVTTANWQQAEKMLQMAEQSCIPSVGAYSDFISKAFAMADLAMGWKWLEQMVQHKRLPKCKVYLNYLQTIAAISKSSHEFQTHLQKLLHFLQNHELFITLQVAEQFIMLTSAKPEWNVSCSLTKLNRLGKCAHCSSYMEPITLSEQEFKSLSDAFLQKVLIRDDVFQKSTPEEVEQFRKFIAHNGPFDVVVDGLNVAYSKGSKAPASQMANMLSSVVNFFKIRQKRILILGRKHMNKWPGESMQYLRKNASLFLTQNLSQDDPFLLYATIKSGQTTDFFSRDLMRTHAYLLGPELKRIFRRWQQEHQYSLITQTADAKIVVKEPMRYMACAHKLQAQNTWHVPYNLEYNAHMSDFFDPPQHWICLQFKK